MEQGLSLVSRAVVRDMAAICDGNRRAGVVLLIELETAEEEPYE